MAYVIYIRGDMKIKIGGFGKYDNNYRFRFSCDEINLERDYIITSDSAHHRLKQEFIVMCKKAEDAFLLSKYKDKWRDHIKHDHDHIENLWTSVKSKILLDTT